MIISLSEREGGGIDGENINTFHLGREHNANANTSPSPFKTNQMMMDLLIVYIPCPFFHIDPKAMRLRLSGECETT